MSEERHSLEDDFEHFLAYTGYGALYQGQHTVLAHLRKAYEQGNDRGVCFVVAKQCAPEAPDPSVIERWIAEGRLP